MDALPLEAVHTKKFVQLYISDNTLVLANRMNIFLTLDCHVLEELQTMIALSYVLRARLSLDIK